MAETRVRETLRFHEFELNLAAYELRRNGRAVRLERLPMDLLIVLVERRGALVTRAEIVDRLWGKDVFVDVETGVHTAIRKIRQALGDSAETPAFIETVAGKGYRFVAPVEMVPNAAAAPAPAPAGAHDATPAARAPVSSRRTAALIAGAAVLGLIAAFAGWRWTMRRLPRE